MSLTKDYYTAAELTARQQHELLVAPAAAHSDPRPDENARRSSRHPSLLDSKSGREFVGAWASGFIHG